MSASLSSAERGVQTARNAGAAAAPTLSIGVPVYNGARVLEATLECLLGQTFQDFEIIISDNASTDATPALCAAYAARDKRIRFFRQDRNVGLPNNWNFVAAQALGRYFKWASSNDLVARDMLELCVGELEAHPDAVLAFGRTALIDGDGKIVRHYAEDFDLAGATPSERFGRVASIALNNAINGVIRREILSTTGLVRPYPASDYVLMEELALQGPFRLIPKTLLFRRTDPSSITTGLERMDRLRLHNPSTRGIESIDLRRHMDAFRVALFAPRIPLGERLKASAIALRTAFWARRQILADLVELVRALVTVRRPGARH